MNLKTIASHANGHAYGHARRHAHENTHENPIQKPSTQAFRSSALFLPSRVNSNCKKFLMFNVFSFVGWFVFHFDYVLVAHEL